MLTVMLLHFPQAQQEDTAKLEVWFQSWAKSGVEPGLPYPSLT